MKHLNHLLIVVGGGGTGLPGLVGDMVTCLPVIALDHSRIAWGGYLLLPAAWQECCSCSCASTDTSWARSSQQQVQPCWKHWFLAGGFTVRTLHGMSIIVEETALITTQFLRHIVSLSLPMATFDYKILVQRVGAPMGTWWLPIMRATVTGVVTSQSVVPGHCLVALNDHLHSSRLRVSVFWMFTL